MNDITQGMKFTIDVKSGLVEMPQRAVLMKGDKNANRVTMALYDGEKTVSLEGAAVTGTYVLAGIKMPLLGDVDGNKATIILPDECYSASGRYELRMHVTMGGVKRTFLFITGYVESDGEGGMLDVEGVIPNIDDIIAQYAEMKAVTERTQEAADKANDAASRAPYVGANGNWYVWNAMSGKYVDTGTKATGPQGPKGDPGTMENMTIDSINGLPEALSSLSEQKADKSGWTANKLIGTDANGNLVAQNPPEDHGGDADTLGGIPAENYLQKTETAANSDKLGGVAASEYATKSAINSEVVAEVEERIAQITNSAAADMAEVISARTDENGTVYTSLKTRIDAGFKERKLTQEFANTPTPALTKSTLQKDGGAYTNAGYPVTLCVSDYLLVSELINYEIRNAMSWTGANAYAIAFYNGNKAAIGNAYAASVGDKVEVTVTVYDIVASYPGAVYMRIGYDSGSAFSLVDKKLEKTIADKIDESVYPSYKVNAYPKIFFGGDSVTKGFVVEGTQDAPSTIYQEMEDYSYPACFGRIYPGADITKVAQSGISPEGYYKNLYPSVDFSLYDLIIIELGLNAGGKGYLNIADWDVEDTSTNYYRQMIAGIRGQNSKAVIVLAKSQYYSTDWLPVLKAIAAESDCIVIDLDDKAFLNLNDTKYHGYYNNNGTPAVDRAHYTRQGYAAKAYVVARWLGVLLP